MALNPGLFQPLMVVLARERCLFDRMDAVAGMKASSALAAARLHAEAASPYQRSRSVIMRRGSTFGIWWWDAAWVGEALSAAGLDPAAKITPEPLVRAGAEGWRVARAAGGYEAQLWRGGFLLADAWRRRPFDQDGWRDFVRIQSDQAGAGDTPPAAQDPPFTLQNPYRRMQVVDQGAELGAQVALGGVVVVLAASAALAGQAVGLNKTAALAEKQAATIRARLPALRASGGQAQVTGLIALRAAVDGPDPMVMLQNAQQTIQPFGHKMLAFTAERDRIRVVLPEAAADDLPAMSKQLLTSPYFVAIKPQLDNRRGRLILDLTPKSAKSTAPKPQTAAPRPAAAKS